MEAMTLPYAGQMWYEGKRYTIQRTTLTAKARNAAIAAAATGTKHILLGFRVLCEGSWDLTDDLLFRSSATVLYQRRDIVTADVLEAKIGEFVPTEATTGEELNYYCDDIASTVTGEFYYISVSG